MGLNNGFHLEYGVFPKTGDVLFAVAYTMDRPIVVGAVGDLGTMSGIEITKCITTGFHGQPFYRTGDNHGGKSAEFAWVAVGY